MGYPTYFWRGGSPDPPRKFPTLPVLRGPYRPRVDRIFEINSKPARLPQPRSCTTYRLRQFRCEWFLFSMLRDADDGEPQDVSLFIHSLHNGVVIGLAHETGFIGEKNFQIVGLTVIPHFYRHDLIHLTLPPPLQQSQFRRPSNRKDHPHSPGGVKWQGTRPRTRGIPYSLFVYLPIIFSCQLSAISLFAYLPTCLLAYCLFPIRLFLKNFNGLGEQW